MISRFLSISLFFFNFAVLANDSDHELSQSTSSLPSHHHEIVDPNTLYIVNEDEVQQNKPSFFAYLRTAIPNFIKDAMKEGSTPDDELDDDGAFFLTLMILSLFSCREH